MFEPFVCFLFRVRDQAFNAQWRLAYLTMIHLYCCLAKRFRWNAVVRYRWGKEVSFSTCFQNNVNLLIILRLLISILIIEGTTLEQLESSLRLLWQKLKKNSCNHQFLHSMRTLLRPSKFLLFICRQTLRTVTCFSHLLRMRGPW